MVTVTLNGEKIKCKTSWNELSTADFIRVYREWGSNFLLPVVDRDYFHLFCLVNDLIFSDFKRTPEIEEAIITLITWAIPDHGYSTKVPERFTIDGRTFVVPKNYTSLSTGQNILMLQKIEKAKFKQELIADAIALSAQPLLDGKFNSDKFEEMKAHVMLMPAKDTYGLGFFWLTHAMQVGHGRTNNFNLPRISLMPSYEKMLRLWLRLTGSKDFPILASSQDTQKDLARTLTKYSIGSALELSYVLQQKLRKSMSTKNVSHTSGIS